MKWYSYLIGYLEVIIVGKFPEKVINMALIRGIFLWDIIRINENSIILNVRLNAFRPLARIARMCNCKIKISKRKGLPFEIRRIKKRKVLALGGIFFILSLYVLSSFVWFIEVKGTEDLRESEIIELAEKFGLKEGVVKKKLDFDKLEEQLLNSHPKLAWVGITVQGTKVKIEISEKELIPETEENQKSHLVANKGGVIKEILVLLGTPVVKEGDKVYKGQILISGIIYPEIKMNEDGTYTPFGEPELVKARGIVRAEVIHSVRTSCPFVEKKSVYTGRKVKQVLLKIGNNKTLILKGPKTIPFLKYSEEVDLKKFQLWRNINIPVEVISKIISEKKQIVQNHGYEGAYREAVKRGEKALEKMLSSDSKILEKFVKVCDPKIKGVIEVEVIWKCLENIAVPQSISNQESSGY